MSKLVDKERLAKLAAALDARAKAAVEAEAARAMAAEEALQGAIDLINDAEKGILAQAKAHAEAKDAELKQFVEEADNALGERVQDLEEVIFGGEGAEDGIDKIKSDIAANKEAIDKLNGGVDEEGSVAKAVADGVKPVQEAVDAVEERVEAIEAEQLVQNGDIDALEGRANALEEKVGHDVDGENPATGLFAEVDEAKAAAAAAKAAADQAQDEVDAVELRMDAAEGDIDGLQEVVNRLDGDVNTEGSVKKQIADAIDKVNGDNSALAGRVEVLEGEMDAVEADIAQVKLDMAAGDAKALEDANKYTDDAITALVDSAPDAMNTLNELAQAISAHQDVYDAYVAEVSAAMTKMKEDLQKEIDTDVAAEAALRAKADEDLQDAIDLKATQADFEAHVAASNAKHQAQDALIEANKKAVEQAQKEVDAVEERMEAAEGEIEGIKGRLDGLDEEQDAQDLAIQAAQAAANKAQGEVDAVEVRMEAAEGAIVANKQHCDDAMAQEVIDRNAAIATALEPYSTTEEVKTILGNVVSTLSLTMENDKVILKLGGAEGIALSEVSLDMASDADIDAIIAGLDEE